MSASPETNDETASDRVVERLDRARARVKDAARKAQEKIAPTLERAGETADSARRQVQAAGQQAVERVKRRPWIAGLALAGVGIGAFLLIRTPARNRVFSAARDLWNRQGSRLDPMALASRVDIDALRERLDPRALASHVDVDGLRAKLEDLADKLEDFTGKVRAEVQRRFAA